MITKRDRIRGSLIAGAVGDALGYTVEFMREDEIRSRYGADGIGSYELDRLTGKAIISDDTQMTLFTANGLLAGAVKNEAAGENRPLRTYIEKAYFDWLDTQEMSFEESRAASMDHITWLYDIPELFQERAPGNTCLRGIRSRLSRPTVTDDYIADPRTNRKGCGGIMRVAPIGLCGLFGSIEEADMEGAQAAAITHGNSLAYMPSALLVHIVNRIVYPEKEMDLENIVKDGEETLKVIFKDDHNLDNFIGQIDKALELTKNDLPDLDNIHILGEGWYGDEAAAIAVYCAVKYSEDLEKAQRIAINHKGDSDSTGAIVGNILGALHGYGAIGEKWKKDLELRDEILALADDLCDGLSMPEERKALYR